MNKNFDIFMPIGPRDYDIAEESVLNKRRYIKGAKNIYYCAEIDLNIPAIYIPESRFPFNMEAVQKNVSCTPRRVGWYYQQLMQLYFGSLGISSLDDYLTVGTDIFFNEEINFFKGDIPIYTYGHEAPHAPYFSHMKRLIPGLECFDEKSAISHHSIFNKKVLERLFFDVKDKSGYDFWVAFLRTVDGGESSSGASEFELYFNYLRANNYKLETRRLNYIDTGSFSYGTNSGAAFFAYHWYLRGSVRSYFLMLGHKFKNFTKRTIGRN